MGRDTITAPSALVGSLLQQNQDQGWGPGTGSLILHDGVPHVTWIEVRSSSSLGVAAHAGPYVARWNGSGWDLLGGGPALPTWEGSYVAANQFALWPTNDGSLPLTECCVPRVSPMLASDGTNLFLAVTAAVQYRMLTNPGDPIPRYRYLGAWQAFCFRLDGSTWTPLGPLGGAGVPGTDGAVSPPDLWTAGFAYASYGDLGFVHPAEISASSAEPGACYLAFSDGGVDFVDKNHFRLVVTGLGSATLAETIIEENVCPFTIDGAGSELAVYFTRQTPAFDQSAIQVWTPIATAAIPAVAFDWAETTEHVLAARAATIDGARYLAVVVDNFSESISSFLWRNDIVVKAIDPTDATTVGHIDAREPAHDHGTVGPRNPSGGTFHPVQVLVEPDNFWLVAAAEDDVPGSVAIWNLDRQCSVMTNWNGAHLAKGLTGHLGVIYQDAFWFYAMQENILGAASPDLYYAHVMRTPICRGCVACESAGLHVWRRV